MYVCYLCTYLLGTTQLQCYNNLDCFLFNYHADEEFKERLVRAVKKEVSSNPIQFNSIHSMSAPISLVHNSSPLTTR